MASRNGAFFEASCSPTLLEFPWRYRFFSFLTDPILDEGVANTWRHIHLRGVLRHVYEDRTDNDGNVRQFRNVAELEQRLDQMGGFGACLYRATYSRFATRDPRVDRLPVDLNQKPSKDDVDWLLRIHEPYSTLELESNFDVKVKEN